MNRVLTERFAGYDTRESDRRRWRELECLIRWYFGPIESGMAIYVAWRSSGMDALAFHHDGTDGIGLFGLMPAECGFDVKDAWLLQNPIRNVAAAHKLFTVHGWSHWKVPSCGDAFRDYPEREGGE